MDNVVFKHQALIEEIKLCISQCEKYMETNSLLGSKNWTWQIKEFLGKLGKSKGCKVCASGKENNFECE